MARAKKNGEFVNCKVRQDIADRLNSYSEKTMIPKTAIVEKAIEEYLDRAKTDSSEIEYNKGATAPCFDDKNLFNP